MADDDPKVQALLEEWLANVAELFEKLGCELLSLSGERVGDGPLSVLARIRKPDGSIYEDRFYIHKGKIIEVQ